MQLNALSDLGGGWRGGASTLSPPIQVFAFSQCPGSTRAPCNGMVQPLTIALEKPIPYNIFP
jgi:hypothetical protein